MISPQKPPTSLLTVNGQVAGKALVMLNETGNQNILTASAAGTTRFFIDTVGTMRLIGAAPAFQLEETDTTNLNWQMQLNAGDLLFRTNNDAFNGSSTKVTFQNTTGNVGIGSTAPPGQLTVDGNGLSNPMGVYLTDTGQTSSFFYSISQCTNCFAPGAAAGDLVFRSVNSKNLLFTLDGGATTNVYLGSNGNVGIGTTSPISRLHVATNTTTLTGKAAAIFDQLEAQDILTA